MLEQRDHRGKRLTIHDEDVDDASVTRCDHAESLEHNAQREICELERARSVSGPDSTNADNEVFKR